jgi:hypothetical protein
VYGALTVYLSENIAILAITALEMMVYNQCQSPSTHYELDGKANLTGKAKLKSV